MDEPNNAGLRWSGHESLSRDRVDALFMEAGEIIGTVWNNDRRPSYVEIISNFDKFGSLGHNLLAQKIHLAGSMTSLWDFSSGKEHRELLNSGRVKEDDEDKGFWIIDDDITYYWGEDDEENSQSVNSKEEVCSALEGSSDLFQKSMLNLLESLTKKIEILHTGEYEFGWEFDEYETVIFLCTNAFDKESGYASKIRDFALRLLKSKHPKQPIAGNPNYHIDTGNPERRLSKHLDEQYCMYRRNLLLFCQKIGSMNEASEILGIEMIALVSLADRSQVWDYQQNNYANNKLGREIREILGVSTKCRECGKFLTNPIPNYCKKHKK